MHYILNKVFSWLAFKVLIKVILYLIGVGSLHKIANGSSLDSFYGSFQHFRSEFADGILSLHIMTFLIDLFA